MKFRLVLQFELYLLQLPLHLQQLRHQWRKAFRLPCLRYGLASTGWLYGFDFHRECVYREQKNKQKTYYSFKHSDY